jgi:hypothetical protein
MNESNNEDQIVTDGKEYWFNKKFQAGNHTYQYFGSDGELTCFTNILSLNVDFGPLAYIEVKPSSTNITTDDYQIFNVKGFDADYNSFSITPKWEVSGGGIIDQNGNFTATTPGKWIIYANVSEISGNATINVISGRLNQIIVTPQFHKISCDDYQLFIATGYDNDMNILPISPYWETTGGGIINQNGIFTTNRPGKWMIFANESGISGNTTITVTLGDLYQIIVIPKNATINLSESIHYLAKGFDANGNELDILPLWYVNGGGNIDMNGKFIGVVSGKWIIFANLSGISGNASVNVIERDNGNETPNVTEPEISDNDTTPDKRKGDSSDSSIWIIISIVIIIVILIVLILFMILKNKKSQNIEEKKDDTQEYVQQLHQINQPQSNNEIKTQNQDAPPSKNINHEQ